MPFFVSLAVCKIYGQQKAIKVKRAVDRKKMLVMFIFAYQDHLSYNVFV